MTGSSKGSFLYILLFTAISGFSVASGQQGIRFEKPRIEGFHPLDEEPYASSQLAHKNPVILELNTQLFRDTSVIDFEKRQITFRRQDSLGYTMWEYHYPELSDYLLSRKNFALYQGWHKGISAPRKQEEKTKPQLMKLQWEIPVQYPSWAQRVLGNDPPRLSIDGNLTIKMGFDHSKTMNSDLNDNTASTTGLDFDIMYNFSIVGSVGRLININIKANSEEEISLTDNLKNFKIEYKESRPGELEDEIIQEVIAGYTGFQMPGQGLAGYQENHAGLFGIKIRSQLGPLKLTTIVSHEQGETNKLTVSNSTGQSSEGGIPYKVNQYLENKFFFLHNIYRAAYNLKYGKGAPSNPQAPPKVTTLEVYRRVDPAQATEIEKLPNRTVREATTDDNMQKYKFELLLQDMHYYLNKEEGWIRFDSITISANDHVAIYLRTESPQISRGEKQDTSLNLWTLKTEAPIDSASADTSRFYLMWRNVYQLSVPDFSNFTLKVETTPVSGIGEERQGNTHISDILGLTLNGKPLVTRSDIFDKDNGVLIIPPYDTSFFGNEPFDNPELTERDRFVYRYNVDRIDNYRSPYVLIMSGTKKQTVFDLGWGVMEGTERVIADGKVLQRDRDYVISYDMGTLELTSPLARTADRVEIEYQREALFVPDRKLFMGMHGELKLPFLGEKSFTGMSILFQNTKILDDIPRLEQEPYNKVLFDVNTRIDLEPEWMTALVNKIPLIKTDASSKIQFDFELAHSRMNPNTENEAYVDDFEESKQPFSIGGTFDSWFQSSPPYHSDSLYLYPPAFDFYWFTPRSVDSRHRVDGREIWDRNEKPTAGDEIYETVVRLHATPAPDTSSGEVIRRFRKAWAGIMTPISSSFMNKERDRYFEFMVKAVGGFDRKGVLKIQMGDMREDISLNGGPPNQMSDKEDTSAIWTDIYRQKDDLGLDRKANRDEYYLIPGEKLFTWDTLYYDSIKFPDPARDDYKNYETNVDFYRYACKKQGDGYLTSEDINFDGTIQTHTQERYFEFTIDLSDADAPYYDKTAKLNPAGGWRKVRIPLKEVLAGYEHMRDSVNSPRWSEIKMVRFIWTDFDTTALNKEQQLIFYDMQFVGNQWQPLYDSIGTKIEAVSINNHEDSEYRSSTRGDIFHWKRDEQTGDYERESALKLVFQNVKEGETALITRNYSYQNINLSAYRNLSLYVYGKSPSGSKADKALLYGGKVDFVFRFGTDDSCYYEYRGDLYSGWNQISIDLRRIAELKDNYMLSNPDTLILDSLSYGKGRLLVKAPRGRQPNLSNIQWMGIGVYREENTAGEDSLSSGELWVNDMKVSGIGKLNGWAMSSRFNSKFADLLDISADLNYEDGDFRRMTENSLKPDNSTLTGNFSSTLYLDKFLPSEWGVSIPVGGSVSGSVTRPQLKTNSDVYLTKENGRSDNLMDMISDAGDILLRREKDRDDMTKAEHYETQNTNNKLFANYSKSSRSDNPIVNLTADRIGAQVEWTRSRDELWQGPAPSDSIGDYVIRTDRESYSGKLKYNLNPQEPPEWTKWKPLQTDTSKWIPKPLKNYEFSLLPERIEFDLVDLRKGKEIRDDNRLEDKSIIGTFDLHHGFALDYSPISPLIDLAYSIGIDRDMYRNSQHDSTDEWGRIFSRHEDPNFKHLMVLWGEKNRTQHASLKLNPQIFDWLSTSGEYVSDYRADMVNWRTGAEDYISAGVKSTLSLNANLNIDMLLKGFMDATGKDGAGKFFELLDKGFDNVGLRQITFNYTAGSDLKNNYLESSLLGRSGQFEFLKYQLGLSGKAGNFFSGNMDDMALGGMKYRDDNNSKKDFYGNDYRTVDQKYSISSGLDLKIPFEISFSPISIGWNRSFKVVPDSTKMDTAIVFPDFSLGSRTSALMKIGFINDALQSLNLSSSFGYRKSRRNTGVLGNNTDFRFDFSPLLSVTGSMKKLPISFTYNFSHSRAHTLDSAEIKTHRSELQNHDIDINYQIEQSSRLSEIRLLTWVIPVKGRTTVGLKGNIGKKVELTKADTTAFETNFYFTPHLTYIFTDNVTGRAEYTYGERKVQGDDKKIIDNRFHLIAEIQF